MLLNEMFSTNYVIEVPTETADNNIILTTFSRAYAPTLLTQNTTNFKVLAKGSNPKEYTELSFSISEMTSNLNLVAGFQKHT